MDGTTFTYGDFTRLVTEAARKEEITIPDLSTLSLDARPLEEISSLDLLNLVTAIEEALFERFESYRFTDLGHLGSRTIREIYEIFCRKLDKLPDYT